MHCTTLCDIYVRWFKVYIAFLWAVQISLSDCFYTFQGSTGYEDITPGIRPIGGYDAEYPTVVRFPAMAFSPEVWFLQNTFNGDKWPSVNWSISFLMTGSTDRRKTIANHHDFGEWLRCKAFLLCLLAWYWIESMNAYMLQSIWEYNVVFLFMQGSHQARSSRCIRSADKEKALSPVQPLWVMLVPVEVLRSPARLPQDVWLVWIIMFVQKGHKILCFTRENFTSFIL